MVDSSVYTHEDFVKLNLYTDGALKSFLHSVPELKFDTLLIDPPRSGFMQLNLWLQKIKPEYLIYVSCNPVSLARDIKTIEADYQLVSLHLLDMFPGTYHYETIALLKINI